MVKLVEVAKILRSKNAGPFEITLDVLFDDKEIYDQIKNGGVITKEKVAKIYHLSIEDIHHLVYFDQALGIKITMARKISSGSPGDRDVYGAQQHVPLMNLEL
ncbi:DUF4387 domain-containing protein [Ureibacillus sinduriensis]|uniref:DUF4387 domain-containing protein n=1 Tax=Ureibacillus sinduriensis BLB-1 = JCM 15800 TaxID=1384057 RepID=A0A0A3HZY6_9BACL|nr:DUF4387 domain-containing protein [Ureibacillus sinduriensis]KGR76795.1 hypothetical protein CD33_04990 [Ureibacillus sinduriensis BLB-1 = JCM 15800]